MEGREAKDRLYEQFARTAKAVASPKRIELLELLAQGEHTVEALARATGMGVTNTSAHLQVLRHARLVETRKHGTRVFYRLGGDEVAGFVAALRDLARARLAEVDRVVQDYFVARDALEPVSRAELGALSIPLDQLEAALSRLPKRARIVAYCRGPYCVLAPQAVQRLRAKGFKARRLADGMPEWRLAGLPVAVGDERARVSPTHQGRPPLRPG